jgi:hypothetical protein
MKKLKHTLIALLTVGGIISLTNGCYQNPESAPTEPANAISDPRLDAVAKSLAASLADQSVRTLVKSEALKKFDGDFNVLYQAIENKSVAGGQTLSTLMDKNVTTTNVDSRTSLASLAEQMPLLNISVPVNIDKWNENSFEPLVVVSPSSFIKDETKLTVVKAYDKNGKVHLLDAKKAPTFPVVVVGISERAEIVKGKVGLRKGLHFNKSGKVQAPCTIEQRKSGRCESTGGGSGGGTGGGGTGGGTLPTSSCTIKRAYGSEEYITNIGASDGDAWEGWFDGGPEFALKVVGYDVNNSAQYLGGYYPFNIDNYRTLHGAGVFYNPNVYVLDWIQGYGEILNYVWREEDTGSAQSFGVSVTTQAVGQDPSSRTVYLEWSANSDEVASYLVYRKHCSPREYGTPTFHFTIRFANI